MRAHHHHVKLARVHLTLSHHASLKDPPIDILCRRHLDCGRDWVSREVSRWQVFHLDCGRGWYPEMCLACKLFLAHPTMSSISHPPFSDSVCDRRLMVVETYFSRVPFQRHIDGSAQHSSIGFIEFRFHLVGEGPRISSICED